MHINELLQEKREDILRLAKEYGAYNVRVFGSVAPGEADEDSDIDLLVTLENGRSLLDLVGL
jgi:predicted nucleotidyltransferase